MYGGIDDQVQQKVDTFRNKPQELQKSYAQNQDLMSLLALQKIKSEKEAAMRQMQMQTQQNPQTIAQQREAELMQMTKNEMAQQQGALQKQQAQQAAKRQQQMLGQGIGAAPAPNMARMARGGVVGFAEGDLVDIPTAKIDKRVQTPYTRVAGDRIDQLMQLVREGKIDVADVESITGGELVGRMVNDRPIIEEKTAGSDHPIYGGAEPWADTLGITALKEKLPKEGNMYSDAEPWADTLGITALKEKLPKEGNMYSDAEPWADTLMRGPNAVGAALDTLPRSRLYSEAEPWADTFAGIGKDIQSLVEPKEIPDLGQTMDDPANPPPRPKREERPRPSNMYADAEPWSKTFSDLGEGIMSLLPERGTPPVRPEPVETAPAGQPRLPADILKSLAKPEAKEPEAERPKPRVSAMDDTDVMMPSEAGLGSLTSGVVGAFNAQDAENKRRRDEGGKSPMDDMDVMMPSEVGLEGAAGESDSKSFMESLGKTVRQTGEVASGMGDALSELVEYTAEGLEGMGSEFMKGYDPEYDPYRDGLDMSTMTDAELLKSATESVPETKADAEAKAATGTGPTVVGREKTVAGDGPQTQGASGIQTQGQGRPAGLRGESSMREYAKMYAEAAGMTPEERAEYTRQKQELRDYYAKVNDPDQNNWDRIMSMLSAGARGGSLAYAGPNMVSADQAYRRGQQQRELQGLEKINALQNAVMKMDQDTRKGGLEFGKGLYESELGYDARIAGANAELQKALVAARQRGDDNTYRAVSLAAQRREEARKAAVGMLEGPLELLYTSYIGMEEGPEKDKVEQRIAQMQAEIKLRLAQDEAYQDADDQFSRVEREAITRYGQ